MFVQVFFAIHYLACQSVVAVIPPGAWATIRVVAAAAVLLVVERVRRGRISVTPVDMAKLALYAVFGVVLNQILFTEGLSRTTPSHSSLICTLIPVSTFLFAILLGRERLSVRKGAGILIALAGVLVLLRVESFSVEEAWVMGDLMTLANAISFGLFLVISRNVVRRYPPLTVTTWAMVWGAMGIAIYGTGDVMQLELSTIPPGIIWTGVWIVIFPTVLAYLLNFYALARVESSTVALFIYLQPLLATLLSVGLGRETLSARFMVSAALVFAGVFLVARGKGVPHARVLEAD